MAEYNPAGPPPRQTIRFIAAAPLISRIARYVRMLYCRLLEVSIIFAR
jgi:hypothetical protein